MEDGDWSFRHELSPKLTIYVELPPEPGPRLSPPRSTTVVPARTLGVHVNPRPSFGTCVKPFAGTGTENDWPPGITPWKKGVLAWCGQSRQPVE